MEVISHPAIGNTRKKRLAGANNTRALVSQKVQYEKRQPPEQNIRNGQVFLAIYKKGCPISYYNT